MAHQGQKTSFAERVEIGERWEAGQKDPEIAAALGRPVATVRKWRRKHQRHGRVGLSSQMGRPTTGVLGQYPQAISLAIQEMRQRHPGWGPMTILVELRKDERWVGQALPSRSRIAAYLKAKDLVRNYERHYELPQPKPQPVKRPHQEWEVDVQGKKKVSGLGSASIINIGDVFSHLKIDSYPCLRTTHANTLDHQLVLRRAFVQYGLPEQISLDHDSVFYDNQTASPFPTVLHLWLIGLGVAVRFIHKPPPAEHAMIERTHQTITQQAVLGQTFADQADLQKMLTARILFLNCDYPSLPLGGQAPLAVFPQAQHTQRPYRLEWEKDILDMPQVDAYLAKGRWFRQTSATGTFSLGAQRYNATTKFPRQTLEITFDPLTREFVCLPEKGNQSFRLASQGVNKQTLIGELDPLMTLPAYQLALPFTRDVWRQAMLCQGLSGTTL
jgi:transposase-like protein